MVPGIYYSVYFVCAVFRGMVIGVKGDEAEDPEDSEEIYFNMYGDKVYTVRVDQAFVVSQFAKSVTSVRQRVVQRVPSESVVSHTVRQCPGHSVRRTVSQW